MAPGGGGDRAALGNGAEFMVVDFKLRIEECEEDFLLMSFAERCELI